MTIANIIRRHRRFWQGIRIEVPGGIERVFAEFPHHQPHGILNIRATDAQIIIKGGEDFKTFVGRHIGAVVQAGQAKEVIVIRRVAQP